MNQEEFIEAVRVTITEVLTKIYKDSERHERPFFALFGRYQEWLDDCQGRTKAAEAQLKQLQHREVDMQSNIDQWRERYERGEKRIEQLEEMVNQLNIRIDKMEKSRA